MKKVKPSTALIIILLLLMVAYYFVLNSDNDRQVNNNNSFYLVSGLNNYKNHALIIKLDSNVSVDFLTGKFDPSKLSEFDLVDQEYASRTNIFLLKETYKAFIKMFYAAQLDGIKLTIVSGTRNFYSQRYIWEQKWYGRILVKGTNLYTSINEPVERSKEILKYSSMPGTSRHHWGTDIDINSIEEEYFSTKEGIMIYEWLKKNAYKYGFCQPFNSKQNSIPRFEEEMWHWTYLPLSSIFLKAYASKVNYSYLKGFAGYETATKLSVINNYVLNVNLDCK